MTVSSNKPPPHLSLGENIHGFVLEKSKNPVQQNQFRKKNDLALMK